MAKAASSKSSLIAQRRAQARNSGDKEYLQRQAKLIKAAGKIFQEKGFRAASINDMAKAVGIDRASLYYYTSGKEELFQEVVREAALQNVEMVESIRADAGKPLEKLERFIVAVMASYEQHYPYLFAYVQEDMAQIAGKRTKWAKEMSELSKRFNDALVAIIEDGFADGSLDKSAGNAAIVALGIVGMCNWSHRWFKPGGAQTAESIGRSFARIVLRGLGRP
jgi:AcrR family transcriptional regulator